MAERSRRPSSDLDAELSLERQQKKFKKSDESEEECQEQEESFEKNLETTERLALSEESGNSSVEGSSLELSIKQESTLESTLIKPAESETRVTIFSTLAGPSGREQESFLECDESSKFSSSQIESGRMGRSIGAQEQVPLAGEHACYQNLSLIGNGAYGTVYKARDLTSGRVVALKKIRVPVSEDGLPSSTLREIATLKQLERFENPYIVKLLDVCQGTNVQIPSNGAGSGRMDPGLTLWLVFEHVEQDLASYMSSYAPHGIPPDVVKRMSKEIILGVDFLHSHRITHRDLKPQNLLVTSDGRIKIADFGLAKTYDFEMRLTTVVVTLWYRAPEVLLGCSYATPVDIWSVGCILAELSRLTPLFPGTSEGDQLNKIFQIIGKPTRDEWPDNVSLSWTTFPQSYPKPLRNVIPNLSEQGLSLVERMLSYKPQERITAAQSLQHPYFTEDS